MKHLFYLMDVTTVTNLNYDESIKLEEINCPICKEGVLGSEICPLCLGHSVLFRIHETFGYVSGSNLYLQQSQKAQ